MANQSNLELRPNLGALRMAAPLWLVLALVLAAPAVAFGLDVEIKSPTEGEEIHPEIEWIS